jgi:hypothetical protein
VAAFLEQVALPVVDRGPVEAWALAMLAAICAGVDMRWFSFLVLLLLLRLQKFDAGVRGCRAPG